MELGCGMSLSLSCPPVFADEGASLDWSGEQ